MFVMSVCTCVCIDVHRYTTVGVSTCVNLHYYMCIFVCICSCLFLSRQLCFIMHLIRTMTLLLLLGAPWPPSLSLTFYRRVLVSNATVANSTQLQVFSFPDGSFRSLRCASACVRSGWCDLFCLDSSSALCLLSNMIVMANYAEKHAGDALPCYTWRRKDLATGASIQAVPSPAGKPPVKENLVDGIYGLRTWVQCFRPYVIDYPWFLLDFGASVTFRTVRLFAQPFGHESMLAKISNIEVRVGTSSVATPGDFRSYDLFARFAGPVTEFGQIVVLEVAAPVVARFLSVQKMDAWEKFQFCHIEVF